MADHNDRNQAPDDLYDEAAPRSIFAATWFRAVLVLIVLGVIGAVAVPYILDAMNAPPKPTTVAKPSSPVPTTPPASAPPGALTQATPTPPTPPTPATPTTPAPPPATSTPTGPTTPLNTPPTPPTVPEKPANAREPMVAATTPAKPEATEAAKPEAGAGATKQAASATVPPRSTSKMAKATAAAVKPASGGQWFVQVGAFKDPTTAKKVATKLRDDNYKVEESTRGGTATVAKAVTAPSSAPSSAGADQYDVIVSGQSPAELSRRLSAKGLTAEATQNGAVVRPSLPLRDAVALSKDLAVDGSKVQVRRAGGAAAEAPRRSSASAATAGGTDMLHRVSVGGFADRATALTTLKELEAKGYKPFLTRR
jgi:SPOR domain